MSPNQLRRLQRAAFYARVIHKTRPHENREAYLKAAELLAVTVIAMDEAAFEDDPDGWKKVAMETGGMP